MTDTPDLEELARQRFTDRPLTEAERKLLQAATKGVIAHCCPMDQISRPGEAQQWGPDREVRPELIEWLCTDGKAKQLLAPEGIQVLGARIPRTLNLSFVVVPFPVCLVGCCLDDLILRSARLPDLNLQNSHVTSIEAESLNVSNNLFLRKGFRASGEIRLLDAHIGGTFDCSDASFGPDDTSPGNWRGVALSADGAIIDGDVFLNAGFEAHGEVRLLDAKIGHNLTCGRGSFRISADTPAQSALAADGIIVEGNVFLDQGFRAEGQIRLLGARISGDLDLSGAVITSQKNSSDPESPVIVADGATVCGCVFLRDGFQVQGGVDFVGAHLHKHLECTDCTFDGWLNIEGCQIEGAFIWLGIKSPQNTTLILANASAGRLLDEPRSWPCHGKLELDGFSYRRISKGPRDANARLAWLARQPDFTCQPYRQLANALRNEGEDGQARRVLFQMEKLRRKQEGKHWYQRWWSNVLRIVVGYGYYPQRALAWLLGLALMGFILFYLGYWSANVVPTDGQAFTSWANGRGLPDHYERFHASIYSIENSFPLVRLGQVDRWQPAPFEGRRIHAQPSCSLQCPVGIPSALLRWFRWVQILAGWFFTTLGIGAVTGLIRRD